MIKINMKQGLGEISHLLSPEKNVNLATQSFAISAE